MKINNETVSEEQVLFNKLRCEEQETILKIMRYLQPCELTEEDKKIEKIKVSCKENEPMTLWTGAEIEIVEKVNEIIDHINKQELPKYSMGDQVDY